MSSCTRHPGKEAVGACTNCGKLVCTACRSEIEGKTYCTVCVEKLFAAEKPPEAAVPVTPVTPVVGAPSAGKKAVPSSARVDTPALPAKEAVAAASTAGAVRAGVNPLWWAAVVFGGWIGGLIAWLLNKEKHPAVSRYMLFGGIGWSALQSIVAVILVVALVLPPSSRTSLRTPPSPSHPQAAAVETGTQEDVQGQVTPARRYTPPAVKPGETGTILTDAPVELTTGTVEAGGGTVTVDRPGDPLNGLQITVPPGAYAGATNFNISSAPITVNTFGSGINPLSPMITVENGGEMAVKAMTVRIPVRLEEGQGAIWYFYDEKTGSLESVPTVAADRDSVTVATTHFSKGFLSSLSDLLNSGTIESGFRPGTDSWQFPNYGSWVSSGGICNGMSLTAIWYYYTRPDGDKTLYGTYDNGGDPNPPTPDFWQDDALTYRFCSLVQDDLSNKSPTFTFFSQYYGAAENITANDFWNNLQQSYGDKLTRKLFESSMLSTHEPQMVWIVSADAKNAHALVVYKVVNGTLYVSDPNYGGQSAQIVWNDAEGKYMPYSGKANANAATTVYEKIIYAGKCSIIPWSTVRGYWDQVAAGTIGDDRFPPYKIYVVDDKGNKSELADGFEIKDKKVKIELDGMGKPGLKINVWETSPFFSKTDTVSQSDGKYEPRADGEMYLGIEVLCDNVKSPGDDEADPPRPPKNDVFVDFKWYKGKGGPSSPELKIEAPAQPGYVGERYAFKALVKDLPEGSQIEWYFKDDPGGDGKRYGNELTVNHTFDSAGDKTVLLQALDKAGKVINLAKDQVTFKVIQPPLTIIPRIEPGTVGQTCFFGLDGNDVLPEDAKYAWTFGNGKNDEGPDGSTVFEEARTYTVAVTATWVDATAKPAKQEHAYGDIKYKVSGEGSLAIIADPAVGTKDEKTVFSVTGEIIPDDVAFYWEFGDSSRAGDLTSLAKDGRAEYTYAKEGIYSVKVSMLDKKNPKPLAEGRLSYNVVPPAALAVAAPAEITQGKGVTQKEYTFKAGWEPGKPPAGATYAWNLDDQACGDKVDCPLTFTAEGPHVLKVKAAWKDRGGAAREAESPPCSFNITSKAGFAIASADGPLQESGKGFVDKSYSFIPDWKPGSARADVSYTWSVDGEAVEDEGGRIAYTFKTEGRHTVSARAAWKDDRGGDRNTDVISRSFNFEAPAGAISLACSDSGIQGSRKGVTKKDYTFNVSWASGKGPTGVRYRWELNDEATGREGAREVFKFDDANEYTLKVIAAWVSASGDAKSADAAISFNIEAATAFSVRCADGAMQGSRKGVPGTYRFYTYWGEGGSAPGGADYTWFLDEEETGDTGEDASFKLAADTSGAPKAYTIRARAEWTDQSGNQKNANSSMRVEITAAPSLSVEMPEELVAGKGVKGGSYTFNLNPRNIPEKALYTWYGDGQPRSAARPKGAWKLKCDNEKDYAIKAVAEWTDTNGKEWTVSSPEVKFHIGPAPTLTISIPADLAAGKGIVGKEYLVQAKPVNVPAGAEYTWYSNGEPKKRGKDLKSGNWPFSEAKTYALKVEAKWTDDSGKAQSAISPEVKFTIGSAATVAVVPPAALSSGKGAAPDTNYTPFSAKPDQVPSDAQYTWFVNGESVGKGNKDKKISVSTDKDTTDYVVKVVATWKANNLQQQTEGSFKFSTAAGIILANGSVTGGSGCTELQGLDQFGRQFLAPIFRGIVINVAGGKATADQTVPFSIEDRGTTLNGSARVKLNGTDNKGVLSGTYSIDSVINYVEDGKTVPIDIRYSGSFKSTAIPANPSNTRVGLTFTGSIQSKVLVQLIIAAAAAGGAACAGAASALGGSSSGGSTTTVPKVDTDVLCSSYSSSVDFTASISGK